jgi:hypothetical protein
VFSNSHNANVHGKQLPNYTIQPACRVHSQWPPPPRDVGERSRSNSYWDNTWCKAYPGIRCSQNCSDFHRNTQRKHLADKTLLLHKRKQQPRHASWAPGRRQSCLEQRPVQPVPKSGEWIAVAITKGTDTKNVQGKGHQPVLFFELFPRTRTGRKARLPGPVSLGKDLKDLDMEFGWSESAVTGRTPSWARHKRPSSQHDQSGRGGMIQVLRGRAIGTPVRTCLIVGVALHIEIPTDRRDQVP